MRVVAFANRARIDARRYRSERAERTKSGQQKLPEYRRVVEDSDEMIAVIDRDYAT